MDDFYFITFYLNKWKRKKAIYWSKLDAFCWLHDWSIRNNVEFSELKNLYEKLPSGIVLCYWNLEYFTSSWIVYF